MSSTPLTPKGAKNASRRQRKGNMTPKALLTTPPSSPPTTSSPGETAADASVKLNQSKKRSSQSAKKPRDSTTTQAFGHRHTSSQPHINSSSQVNDSLHYAGPTFHASPAPSALPMPSFLSVPDSDPAPRSELEGDASESGPDLETTPSKAKPRPLFSRAQEQNSTPLDFLFRAAVEARGARPPGSPEATLRDDSSSTDTDLKPALLQGSTEASGGGVFPLELDSPALKRPPMGPSFATPYRDRINALRSASSPSPATTQTFEEDQRRAKTQALKSLLLNPRPQRPSSAAPLVSPVSRHADASSSSFQSSNRSNAVPCASPFRISSGLASPIPLASPYGPRPPILDPQTPTRFSPGPLTTPGFQDRFQDSGPSFNPDRSFSASVPMTRPAAALASPNGLYYQAYSGSATTPTTTTSNSHHGMQQPPMSPLRLNSVSHSSRGTPIGAPPNPLDTKQMEDDLRRILKLDAPGAQAQATGVQSSLA